MTIKSKTLFVLLGDDRTGKTTLQKLLIEKICLHSYDRLPVNLIFPIKHPEIKRKYLDISFGNRSYQEKSDEYGTVDEYFNNHFRDADIAFISSHLNPDHAEQIIQNGHARFFNVVGVFFSNSIHFNLLANSRISSLNWDERLIIDNPINENQNVISNQLNLIADNIVIFIANRASVS
jgi:hypothetical protein